MKAIVTLKSVSRGDNGDTIKFIDDASSAVSDFPRGSGVSHSKLSTEA